MASALLHYQQNLQDGRPKIGSLVKHGDADASADADTDVYVLYLGLQYAVVAQVKTIADESKGANT